jgi:hypothetical protein
MEVDGIFKSLHAGDRAAAFPQQQVIKTCYISSLVWVVQFTFNAQ